MTPIQNIDPYLAVYAAFDSVFRMVFPMPEARRMLGFKAISERREEPCGWFLWFDECPGVYSMELALAEHMDDGDARGSVGIFVLKYYPGLDDPCLASCLHDELVLRRSDVFDHTGTPTLDGMRCIGEDQFVIGFLDVMAWHGGGGYEFRLRSTEASNYDPLSEDVPERDGRSPVWRLSWQLVDKLITAFCNHYRLPPADVAVQRQDGAVPRTRYMLSACLGCHGVLDELLPLLKIQRLTPHELAGFVQDFDRWINPDWWLAANFRFNTEGVDFID